MWSYFWPVYKNGSNKILYIGSIYGLLGRTGSHICRLVHTRFCLIHYVYDVSAILHADELIWIVTRGCYFQEGTNVTMDMGVDVAYQKALETVVKWIHRRVNPMKTQVLFRTYAPVHFRFVSMHIVLQIVCDYGFDVTKKCSVLSSTFCVPLLRLQYIVLVIPQVAIGCY